MMRWGRWTLVWVSLLVVANGAQGIVLCTGVHGHVAMEPAGHHHCPNPVHNHAGHDPDHQVEVTRGSDHDHCEPCVDIPMFWGPVVTSDSSMGDVTDAVSLVVQDTAALLSNARSSAGSSTPLPVAAYYFPLDSIILQV